MSFAELVLRLGVAFVGWIVIVVHMIALLTVRIAMCPGGDTAPWRLSMATAVLASGAAFALLYGHRLKGAAAPLRYLVPVLLGLMASALWLSLPYLADTTFGRLGLCDVRLGQDTGMAPADWERAWAPLQLMTIVVIVFNSWRLWHLHPRRMGDVEI